MQSIGHDFKIHVCPVVVQKEAGSIKEIEFLVKQSSRSSCGIKQVGITPQLSVHPVNGFSKNKRLSGQNPVHNHRCPRTQPTQLHHDIQYSHQDSFSRTIIGQIVGPHQQPKHFWIVGAARWQSLLLGANAAHSAHHFSIENSVQQVRDTVSTNAQCQSLYFVRRSRRSQMKWTKAVFVHLEIIPYIVEHLAQIASPHAFDNAVSP
mmetsp:Transcript_1190/g.1744  ORF Transcript_1190/g.1744 Transcript_1190/m.1744 type:complete len:206 (-) Transcript_1190:451-1068(-)